MIKVLLVIHGAISVALMGSATHHGLCARHLWTEGPVRERLLRVYRGVLLVSYLVVGSLGLWIYPSFRTEVRTPRFDAQHPLVHAFFEVKEYSFLFGLLALLGLCMLGYGVQLKSLGQTSRRLYAVMSLFVMAVVWMGFFVGLSVTAIQPV